MYFPLNTILLDDHYKQTLLPNIYFYITKDLKTQ